MNKIYKVVWNKARNCYVVGSEFISSHSTGKTSVIGSKSINAVLAVAAVCSMLYLGSSNVFAADAGLAQPVHYVAIHTTDTSVASKKYTVDNKEYTYTLQKVTYTDSNNKEQTAYYYVRDGYSVEMDQDKRHDEASTSNVLRVYRNEAADDTELLQSSQVMIKDAMNKNQEPIQTITGNTLQDVSAGTYVGASNGGGTGTPIDGSYEYFIQDNGKWVDARGVKTTGARFESLTSSSNGTYKYKGQVVSIDNLYTVTEGGKTKVGVFVTSDGNLYTGKVFGRHNEVLMTTKNNDTIYSYWAAETMDPDSKIENMTIGQLNNMFDRTNTNVKKVAGDTIDRVDVAEASDKKGGTISLMRRGTYNSTTGLYENSVAVAGALKITSSGGENGNDDDVAINISQADGKGKYEKKFSIKAGSVVKANSDGENKGELQSITINGYRYTIPYTVEKLVAGDGISIVNKDGVYTISANIKGGSTPTDDVKVDPEKPGEGGNTSGATTDTPVTPVDPDNTGNTDNPGNTENPSNGNGLIITAETRPTNFGDDSGKAIAVKPGENLAIKGDTTNITTTASDHGITVSLKKDITVDSVTAGDTKMTNDGLTITGGPSITKSGIDADDKKITNVADGIISKGSKDAINGGQLYNETRVAKDGNFVKQSNTAGENLSALDNQVTANTESIYHMNGRISDLDNRVNKVGAGAAALAALHPLDFDPDAKWDFAAGYGNYRGANAAAVGAYYRPNEDTMFSVGGTFGNGENMVNAGVSFKLGSGSSHVSTSRVAMAKEIKELRGELEAMKSAMLDANAGKKIDTSKLQLFPDVPQNHWAYEYVAQLAGNGMIEGYPDGNFAGDRPMTRYEFAAILYRAMTKGAVLSDKLLSEFSHELEYFTVDTIAKDKAGNPTIQRVRTVKENKNK